jgi:hypothetical protein
MPATACPIDVMREWSTGNERFLFKKVLYFRETYDAEAKDRILLPLLYKQAVTWFLACEWLHFVPPNATAINSIGVGSGGGNVAVNHLPSPSSTSLMSTSLLTSGQDDDRPLHSPTLTPSNSNTTITSSSASSSMTGTLLKGPTFEQCVEMAALQLFITYGLTEPVSSQNSNNNNNNNNNSVSSGSTGMFLSVSSPAVNSYSSSSSFSSLNGHVDVSAPASSPLLTVPRHRHIHELPKCIPKLIYAQKKPSDWEQLLNRYHQQHLAKFKALTVEQAMREYLTIVQQWTFYGTQFFHVSKSSDSKKPMSKVVLGVNEDGIVVLRKEGERVYLYPWSQLKNWSASLTSFTFETYPFGDVDLTTALTSPKDSPTANVTISSSSNHTNNLVSFGPSSTTHEFETTEGETIAAIVQMYIDSLFDKIVSLHS